MNTNATWPQQGFRSAIEFRDCSIEKLIQLNEARQSEAKTIYTTFKSALSEQPKNQLNYNYHTLDKQGNDSFYMRMESDKKLDYCSGEFAEKPILKTSYLESEITPKIEGVNVKTAQQYIDELHKEMEKIQAEIDLELAALNLNKANTKETLEQSDELNTKQSTTSENSPSTTNIQNEQKSGPPPTIGQLIAGAIQSARNKKEHKSKSSSFTNESIPEQCLKLKNLVTQITESTSGDLTEKSVMLKNSLLKLNQSIMSEVKQGFLMNKGVTVDHIKKLQKDLEYVQPLVDYLNEKAPQLNKIFNNSGLDISTEAITQKLKDITQQVKQSLTTIISALSKNDSGLGIK
ncbi:hypothetical protein ACTFQF_00130 [Aliivibrio fischeri]|uniref:hypothetical protein n=1 Tax=Aliivibrio fischeri TaxID=668 RepID=UPI0007C457A2|nr:hypothetical protein [Aliivibrio fischeri]